MTKGIWTNLHISVRASDGQFGIGMRIAMVRIDKDQMINQTRAEDISGWSMVGWRQLM